MARKEFNVFSMSFLDLLCGALAAVIILFIVVPKMTQDDIDTIQELNELDVQQQDLRELIEQARNAIPKELYQQIQEELENMRRTIDNLTEKVNNLQRELSEATERNQQLETQIEEMQQQIENDRQRITELEREITKLKEKPAEMPSFLSDRGEVEVFILWKENVDIDLYVQNMGNGEICQQPGSPGSNSNVRSWGALGEDINNQRLGSTDGNYYEIFYQIKPVPGSYKIYYNIFHSDRAPWNGRAATVSGFAVIFPRKPNQKIIDFTPYTLNQAMVNHVVGILEVTENDIQLR